MNVTMFTSWQVRCGIASYASHLVAALCTLDDTRVSVVPYDRKPHPRQDYARWGRMMNAGDVTHIQHEYPFFGYLLPWQNYYHTFVSQIRKPLVVTRHVSFDGPLLLPGKGYTHVIRQFKWWLYNRGLGPYATYLNKGTFDVAQEIIVLTQRIKDHLVARGITSEKIHVIPAGVPEVPPAHGGKELRSRWGWEGKRIAGIFGYITPAKGHSIALDALTRLPDDYVLVIAGGLRREADRLTLTAIERQIAHLGLQRRVRITGYLPEAELPAHIDACNLLVYPATHVDSSYSVVTGLAYQTVPLIASDVYGHREVAENGGGLALFKSGDAADLAWTIQDVANNPQRQASMIGDMARYAREHSWQAVAQQTRAVYKQAIAGFTRRAGT